MTHPPSFGGERQCFDAAVQFLSAHSLELRIDALLLIRLRFGRLAGDDPTFNHGHRFKSNDPLIQPKTFYACLVTGDLDGED